MCSFCVQVPGQHGPVYSQNAHCGCMFTLTSLMSSLCSGPWAVWASVVTECSLWLCVYPHQFDAFFVFRFLSSMGQCCHRMLTVSVGLPHQFDVFFFFSSGAWAVRASVVTECWLWLCVYPHQLAVFSVFRCLSNTGQHADRMLTVAVCLPSPACCVLCVQMPEQYGPVCWLWLCVYPHQFDVFFAFRFLSSMDQLAHCGCVFTLTTCCILCVQVPEQYGPVRTLSQGKGALVLIGTTKNCILQGSLDLEFSPIIQVIDPENVVRWLLKFFFLQKAYEARTGWYCWPLHLIWYKQIFYNKKDTLRNRQKLII